jgi:hypothetical protein
MMTYLGRSIRFGGPLAIALGAMSCSAVLGLDEPTHRSDAVGHGSGGAAGTSAGAGGSAGSATGSGGGAGDNTGPGAGGSQTAGSGGASGSGGAAGTSGAAGSPDAGAAGSAKDGGVEAGPPTCATLPLCDDFETTMPETRPNMTKWIVQTMLANDTILVDGSHFPGLRTVRIESSSNPNAPTLFSNKAQLNIGQVWFTRMRVFVEQPVPMGIAGFMGIKDEATNTYLLLSIENGYLDYRSTQNGGFRMLPSSNMVLQQSFKIPTGAWFCVEMEFDADKGQVQTWVDGNDIPWLHADGMPTPGLDDTWTNAPFKTQLHTISFGWWGLLGPAMKVWMDDVAVGTSRIGCN